MIGQISSRTCENIYTILNELNLFDNLPKDKQVFIEKNRGKKYQFEYNKDIPLQEQIKDKETKIVLSYIFLKYINKDKQIKQVLLDRYKRNEIEYQKEIKEKYSTKNLFKEQDNLKKVTNAKIQSIEEQMIEIVEYKENVFKKFINKIKDFLHLN